MVEAMTTAFNSVKTDFTSMVTAILPIAGSIFALFTGAKLGFKFFRRVTNG